MRGNLSPCVTGISKPISKATPSQSFTLTSYDSRAEPYWDFRLLDFPSGRASDRKGSPTGKVAALLIRSDNRVAPGGFEIRVDFWMSCVARRRLYFTHLESMYLMPDPLKFAAKGRTWKGFQELLSTRT